MKNGERRRKKSKARRRKNQEGQGSISTLLKLVENEYTVLMDHLPPSPDVLQAFGLGAITPVLLEGGQGRTYVADTVILKPVLHTEETLWRAKVLTALSEKGFRVSRPIRSLQQTWMVDGWCAFRKVVGYHCAGLLPEKLSACRAFHAALAGIPRPGFFDHRQDPWSVADRFAWGELSLPLHPSLQKPVDELRRHTRELSLPSQIIHGDFGGNVLFAENLPPAVIDFSPYWRPAGFAIAVMLVDMLIWENADRSILENVHDQDINQLLLRAEIRRLVEIDQRFRQFGSAHLEKTTKHLRVVEMLRTL